MLLNKDLFKGYQFSFKDYYFYDCLNKNIIFSSVDDSLFIHSIVDHLVGTVQDYDGLGEKSAFVDSLFYPEFLLFEPFWISRYSDNFNDGDNITL